MGEEEKRREEEVDACSEKEDATSSVDSLAMGSGSWVSHLPLPCSIIRDDVSMEEILLNSDFGESKASDLAEETANQEEVDRLKELLCQKESELTLLKQQIEEEKVLYHSLKLHDGGIFSLGKWESS
ncbi:hypothetical protein Taro_013080 [Colocasia esculenta]|uniref:Uncharacterized protein n=1 Tax=Colocasia esculenta TaxID=4460 RepID=A0A843UHN2_COLES|nr:hypothetical protein [Colocasia esculenta]